MTPATQTPAPDTWRTRITELFDVRYPILAGGLMWLADASYVSAVVRAGAMAFMTARSFDSLQAFGQELDRCLELSEGHAFGVNLTLLPRDEANEALSGQLETALAAGVRHFETVGPAPGTIIDRIHAAGGVVVHKSSTLDHALKAQAQGADALALVGAEAGGHPGVNGLPASLLCASALEQVHRPLAWGGGIGTGRQIASALALGCDAVLIGSRLLVCDEVPAHARYKDHLVACGASDTVVTLRSTGHPWRVLANATAREVLRLEATSLNTYADFGELARDRTARDRAYRNGDPEQGLLSLGPAIGFANRREPVASILGALMEQARDSLSRVPALHHSLRQPS
jgi:nitronate monooxygenase